VITTEQAQALAQRWIAAWNAHDLAAILVLYTDDFSMSSPYIAEVTGEASGRLDGKDAVGAYWRRALVNYPDLEFELLHVFCGVEAIALTYRILGGRMATEFLRLNSEGLISAGVALYGD
jgi:hypothetical protein